MTVFTPTDFNNKQDPAKLSLEERDRVLLDRMIGACHGFPRESVRLVSLVMIVNTIRQTCPTAQKAEAKWDEFAAKAKEFLMNHYFPGGLRKSVFAFKQMIAIPFIRTRDR